MSPNNAPIVHYDVTDENQADNHQVPLKTQRPPLTATDAPPLSMKQYIDLHHQLALNEISHRDKAIEKLEGAVVKLRDNISNAKPWASFSRQVMYLGFTLAASGITGVVCFYAGQK